MKAKPETYRPENHVRVVTAASLFDGHDAAINIMRRIIQDTGVEVIHLGHNRSVAEIVETAVQEDAQGIAITSYQGGHLEFFRYMHDLLQERGAVTKVFGGGGGTILPEELKELHDYGIARIYSPDDGRAMGLQGMINDLVRACDFPTCTPPLDGRLRDLPSRDPGVIAGVITVAENHPDYAGELRSALEAMAPDRKVPVLGVTGTGGSGKSSLVDEFVRRFLLDFPDKSVAIVSVDPSKRRTGGALLGDRIRMNAIHSPRVYMRSLATRQSNLALSRSVRDTIAVYRAAGFDLIVVETSGIGQSDTEVTEHADVSLYVMTADYGAATQLEKIDMLDFADLIALNKFDHRGALDALRDVRKQYKRNHGLFEAPDEELPVFGTIASSFNDGGTNELYCRLMHAVSQKTGADLRPRADFGPVRTERAAVLPPERTRYLAEIAEDSRRYDGYIDEQCALASSLCSLRGALDALGDAAAAERPPLAPLPADPPRSAEEKALVERYRALEERLDADAKALLRGWPALCERYRADTFSYEVRGKVFERPLFSESLARTRVPKIALPRYRDWGDILRWLLTENVPGSFPYAAGVFPLKRVGEDPARQFAGEGGPERTNKRFHYLTSGQPAVRLSTAFDSVTLYGQDPDHRPDIFGKIGNSGVSIASLDDAKKLYSGFRLTDPKTSVSMTINGPAPIMLAFFMNAAVDQECELYLREKGLVEETDRKIDALFAGKGIPRPRYRGELPPGHDGLGLLLLGTTGDRFLPPDVYQDIRARTLSTVRGTVQADILKEDQAQNTCIFSTEFALTMMGDIQEYFSRHRVRNFYSVSISGYHIAEAGANPITQLAFTLANGFTYVEYYLSRGLPIDAFAPNLSFFFSNGIDAEYAVLGRVARRIWAKAIRSLYGGNERSQKLKYHIQTSGRSLHAQEIGFNDIRTTLQALYAIYDNCNSLHTNAYDEAITTPTEESVRRALAIQLIINRELGLAKNENPLQGSFVVEELTDLVEQAVLEEFRRISERGGVLGAMERMYQRAKIQEESLYYESRKHSGDLPIVGVNTFLSSTGSPTIIPEEVIRSTPEEREFAIACRDAIHRRHADEAPAALEALQKTAVQGGNIFETMLETAKTCTLGQISDALYDVGGQYRRNM